MRRGTANLAVGATLLFVYVALTGNARPGNLALGVLVTAGVLSLRPRQSRAPAAPRRTPAAAALAVLRFVAGLALDIVRCGLQVARQVLTPAMPIRPGVLAVRSGCRSRAGVALSAHAITVTPGEMIVEIGRDGTLYVHCLDIEASARTADAEQARRRGLIEGPDPAGREPAGPEGGVR